VDVAMVVRGPVHVVPRDMFGRPIQHTTVLLSHLPLVLRDAIAMRTIGLAVGDLSRWGIVRPPMGPNRMIEESGRIPILDIGTIAMVKKGRIRVVAAVQEILSDGVRFAGGLCFPLRQLFLRPATRPVCIRSSKASRPSPMHVAGPIDSARRPVSTDCTS
jgi:indole-3-pyruvate monooxygenase